MKRKGKTAKPSPISNDLEPAAQPKFGIVDGRQVPIIPVSVLLELAKYVAQVLARQEQEEERRSTESVDASQLS